MRAHVPVCLLSLLACGRASTEADRTAPHVTASGGRSAPSIAAASPSSAKPEPEPQPKEPGLAPLAAPAELVALEVPRFRPAVVSVPLGATEARPVVIALHGNFDRPEWQCEVWRAATEGYPFVLCPRGVPRGDVPKAMDRWEYTSAVQMAREVEASLAALSTRFEGYVSDGPVVFVGFSLGAIFGVPLIKKEPARYPRVVLIEGGLGAFDRHTVKRFKAGGGGRLLFACGQAACTRKARALVRRLEQEGLEARVVDGGNIGHTYDGAIAEGVRRELRWLVDGLPGWPKTSPLGGSEAQ